jgi:signal transduction histidine kinase
MDHYILNVAEHSGVEEAEVELLEHDGRIELYISDSGVGFNPGSAKQTSGLGLICMQERLRLVGGSFPFNPSPCTGREFVFVSRGVQLMPILITTAEHL